MIRLFLNGLIIFFLFSSCSVVPVTKRVQLKLVNEKKLIDKGEDFYSNYKRKKDVDNQVNQADLVLKVGNRMSKVVEAYLDKIGKQDRYRNYNWEFNVVDSDEINAFCVPGGKVIFNTGILPITKDETGIAVVMSHEIAHAIARHGNERQSQNIMVAALLIPVYLLIGSLGYTLIKSGAQLGLLGYSRKHESEADKMGLVFMALAGYNPEEAISFWQRMEKASMKNTLSVFSTHPPDKKRIKRIKKFLPKAMKYYNPS